MFDDYIFVTPSFMRGAARTLDLGATLRQDSYLLSGTPEEADARALASDWRAVERDLEAAQNTILHGEKESAA
jgi:hypothetical protein